MTPPPVHLIETGVANTASWEAAFRRLRIPCIRTSDPRAVASAERVVLPGVGAFDPGIVSLRSKGLDQALRTRWSLDYPTLAVCLGLQLLCRASEESAEGLGGLGLLPVEAKRLPDSVAVPQIGWNAITAPSRARFLESGFCYFANSFGVPVPDAQLSIADYRHGDRFLAGFERGEWLACQFHPELSGALGTRILGRWLGVSVEVDAC